ncbi:MAG: zinc-dependent metalloprotease [Chthonomonas sp.]|nr:zinc-dependent metalloprotease [Chthonomonas sp.]
MRSLRLSSLALLALLSAAALAQTAEIKKDDPPKPDPKIVEYDKAIKDLPKTEGPVTLYIRKKDILMEIPESKLGKLFFLQGAWNTGFSVNQQQGLPLALPTGENFSTVDMFRLEKQQEDRVWMIRPNTKFRWQQDDPNLEAIKRTFPEAFYQDFRIEQTHPEKKLLLINVTGLFSGDLFSLTKSLSQGGMMVTPDREKTRVDKVTGSPDVLSLRMDHFYTAQEGGQANPLLALLGMAGGGTHQEDSRSINFKITYSMYFRDEKSTYRPRLGDPRVGYFTNDHFSFERYYRDDRMVKYINRWNLQKKDPNAALSEPVKPITWVLDTSIPTNYRECFRRGMLDWNRAFEKIGYKNAIVVKDAPAGKDYDHADGRNNVIRWTVTSEGDGAIALFRSDPMTGEIMNAAINVDGTFAVGVDDFYRTVLPTSPGLMMKLFRQSISDAVPGQSEAAEKMLQNPGISPLAGLAEAQLTKNGWHHDQCGYGRERMARLNYNLSAINARGMAGISKQKLIEDYIQDTVAHEFGHTLGLRHNFAASTNLTTAQCGDEALVRREGFASSVMDYIDINMVAVLNGRGVLINPGIGAYDMHAIRYGYSDIKADTPDGERFALSQIAKDGGKPGLRFMTDEDADRFDPTVQRWDSGKDPLAYNETTMRVARNTMNWAIKNLPKPGESYAKRNKLISTALTQIVGQASRASRFIGGLRASRTYAGDVGQLANLTPIPAAEQRQGLRLATSVLNASFGDLPDSVLNSFAEDFNADAGAGTATFRSLFAMMQQQVLGSLMNAGRISRIIENEFKTKTGAYTVDEHYAAINNAVMSEFAGTAAIRPLRRDLQRNYVIALLDQAGGVEGAVRDDAQLVALANLKGVRKSCMTYAAKASGVSKLHAEHLAEVITLFLNRTRVTGVEGGGGGGGLDLAALLGGKN